MGGRNITQHQVKAFAHRYAMDFDAQAAALHAGSSDKGVNSFASRMLNRGDVNSQVTAILRKRCEDLDVKAEFVLQEAITNLWLAREKKDVSGANKALEIIGRHVSVQAFKDNVDVNMPSVTVHDFTGSGAEEEEEPVAH